MHQKNRARFGVAIAFEWNHCAIAHAVLLAQSILQVFWMDIQTRWRDDDILFASAETQIPFCVHFPQVAGIQPALFAGRLKGASFPVACRDVFSADKNFAVPGYLEFAAGEDFAHRTFRRTKRMIQADERSSFRHAVALNYGVSHAFEETLRIIRKRRAPGNESPKLPAQSVMDSAKHPGATEELSAISL